MSFQVRVGLFVSLGVIGFCVLVTLLGGEFTIFKTYSYLYAEMEQVQGLTRGSVVSLAGMNIGNIEKISFSEHKKTLTLKMRIQPQYLDRVKVDSVADTRTQGALGDKYVYISSGSEGSASVKDGDTVPTLKSTDLLEMIAGKSSSAEKAFEIVDEIYKIVKTVNADNRLDHMIGNITDATQDLKLAAADGHRIMSELSSKNVDKVNDSIARLDSILTKIDRGDGSLGALINDPSIHEKLKAMLGSDTRKQAIQSVIRDSLKAEH